MSGPPDRVIWGPPGIGWSVTLKVSNQAGFGVIPTITIWAMCHPLMMEGPVPVDNTLEVIVDHKQDTI